MRLCSYVMTHDFGFAPNPFGGYCTLAACTPNHCRVNLGEGDWLVGHSSVQYGQELIYAMKILEVLGLDCYYREPRFQFKKPQFGRTLREACGDNIYYKNQDGTWGRHKSGFHTERSRQEQDQKGDRVFIAKHFYYFGRESVKIPDHLKGIIHAGPSCNCKHPEPLARAFVDWLQTSYTPGRHALPRDFEQTVNYLPQSCKDVSGCAVDVEAGEGTTANSGRTDC